MAFLKFGEFEVSGGAPAKRASAASSAAFSPLERIVIALAGQDRLASLRQPGRLSRLMTALFGGSTDRRLAEPKLEALRRFAVLARLHRGPLPEQEVAGFRLAGFSPEQADLLITLVGGRRA